MTPEQYDHWKDFAVRMARTCFKGYRRPGPRHILSCVQEFFADIETTGGYGIDMDTLPVIEDWCNSSEWPEGNPHFERTSNLSYCNCDGVRYKTGKPDPACTECRGAGLHYAVRSSPLVCDIVSGYEESWMPDYWHGDGGGKWERRRDRWCDPPHICVRAGLDMAMEQSGGVLGYTAGDLRRMYPEGVPEWIVPKDEKLVVEHLAECAVGYVFAGEPKVDGTFKSLPDGAGIWL